MTADLTLITVTVELESGNTAVATYLLPVKRVSVANSSQYRFNVTLLPNKITLTVLNVIVDDEDLFICKVLSVGGGGTNMWGRKIQVTFLCKLTN